jgi:hypothetical protein
VRNSLKENNVKRLAKLASKAQDLRSLSNETMCQHSLYVMQNVHGLIKIGRSVRPGMRLRQLEQQTRCSIEIIATFSESGHLEELVHLELKRHHIAHEWFCGSEPSRKAIERLFEIKANWPFAYDPLAVQTWISQLLDQSADTYWRRQERNVIKALKSALTGEGQYATHSNGSLHLDTMIGRPMGYLDCAYTSLNGETAVVGVRDGDTVETEVPHYTRSCEAATTLWLPDVLPEIRSRYSKPLEVCMAALCDRWALDAERLKPG